MATYENLIDLTLLQYFKTKLDTFYDTKYQSKDGLDAVVSTAVAAAISNINHFKVVETLPETGESNTIYLVPKTDGTGTNVKDEYIYVDGAFEKIGDTAPDLSGYVTSDALTTTMADYVRAADMEVASNEQIEALFTPTTPEVTA